MDIKVGDYIRLLDPILDSNDEVAYMYWKKGKQYKVLGIEPDCLWVESEFRPKARVFYHEIDPDQVPNLPDWF